MDRRRLRVTPAYAGRVIELALVAVRVVLLDVLAKVVGLLVRELVDPACHVAGRVLSQRVLHVRTPRAVRAPLERASAAALAARGSALVPVDVVSARAARGSASVSAAAVMTCATTATAASTAA